MPRQWVGLLAWAVWRLAHGALDVYLLAHVLLFGAWTAIAAQELWRERKPVWCAGCGQRRPGGSFCPACGSTAAPRALDPT